MTLAKPYRMDTVDRVSDRTRLVALCAGILGLFINNLVCVLYQLNGAANLIVYAEVGLYNIILTTITVCAYRNYRVKQICTAGLLAMFTVFWLSCFIESWSGQLSELDYPLALFVPLFLVLILNHRLLLTLAPIQALCVYLYTNAYAFLTFGENWSVSDQQVFSIMMAIFSGVSFAALGVIAYARERADERLLDLLAEKEQLASTDGLTGLMNRRAFMDHLRRMWPTRKKIRIAFIDLDHFKPLNDQFGHAVGDRVLRIVSDRISQAEGVLAAARLGGDEFAIVMDEQSSLQTVDDDLCELHRSITSDIQWESGLLTIGASIGFAQGKTSRQSLSGLLRSADTAMRRAKNNRLDWAIFNPRVDNEALATSTLEMELKSAIKNGQIKAAVQPIADAKSRKTVAYELLARWTDSGFERDPSPTDFIPIAEKLGLLNEILWVTLEEALRHLELSQKRLAINVSPAQLLASDFLESLNEILDKHGVGPSSITIEVTEEVAFRNVDRNVAILTEAREMGIQIALDDFGTGYSSLSMLDTLPLDKLKIDQSFVRKSNQSAQSKSILLAAIRLAKQLGLESCVEGIESSEVAARVAILGADHIQGYWLGRPELINDLSADLKIAS